MPYAFSDLIECLHKYRDATIMVGPEIFDTKFTPEYLAKMNKHFYENNPEQFFDFLFKKVFVKKKEIITNGAVEAIKYLCENKCVKYIVDFNTNGVLSYLLKDTPAQVIEFHGSIYNFTCTNDNCGYVARTHNQALTKRFCRHCGSAIRPDMLLRGECYSQDIFYYTFDKLQESHALFAIGIDYSEEAPIDLILSYTNATKPDKTFLIGIHKDDLGFDLNDIVYHDFISQKKPEEALSIIIESLKGRVSNG